MRTRQTLSRFMRIAIRNLVAPAALTLVMVSAPLSSVAEAPAAGNSARDATVTQLRALESSWPGPDVSVSVPAANGGSLRIGDELSYRFQADAEGYLTAIHVDTHGATTLLYPRADAYAGRVGGRPVGESAVRRRWIYT